MSVACPQKVAMFSPVATSHNLMDILPVPCHEAPEMRYRPHGENVNASARCHPCGRHITNRMSEAGLTRHVYRENISATAPEKLPTSRIKGCGERQVHGEVLWQTGLELNGGDEPRCRVADLGAIGSI